MLSLVAAEDPLLEAAWVLVVYGWWSLLIGVAVAVGLVGLGSGLRRRGAREVLLVAAVVTLWIAIFLGVDDGYRTWQQTPDPPDEAFSDTGGPFGAMVAGWVPALAVLWPLHLWLVHVRRGRGRNTPPPLPSRPAR